MKRGRREAVGAVAGMLFIAAAALANPQEEVEAFREKAMKERERLGLSSEEAATRYPTPELELVDAKTARAGETVELRAAGTLGEGAHAVVSCPQVKILSMQVETGGLTAKVKVPEWLLPVRCDWIATAPVSGSSTHLPALEVIGSYVWELQLRNGMTMKGETHTTPGLRSSGTVEFFERGRSLGKREARVSGSADAWSLEIERTAEESQQLSARQQEGMKKVDTEGAMKRMQAISEKMQAECSKLPSAQMSSCFMKYQKAMEEAGKPLQQAADTLNADTLVHAGGCLRLELSVKAGKVSGEAEGCRKPGTVKVTGTVTAKR